MNGLELDVGQRAANERWDGRVVVEEQL
jgi:hypothetical protein